MTPPGMGSESPTGTCTYGFAVKSIDEETRTVTARLTDASVDRMAEVIPLAAWRTPLPASVPALWAHDWSRPALGRWHGLQIGGDGMYGRATFAAAGTSPDADLVYGLVKAGVICDVSVGFRTQREVGRDGTVQYREARYPSPAVEAWRRGVMVELGGLLCRHVGDLEIAVSIGPDLRLARRDGFA